MEGKPSTLATAKEALRRRVRAARDAIPPAERQARSEAIAARLLALPEVQAARSLFVYLAVGAEVATDVLVQHWLGQGRQLAVPRLDGPAMMHAAALDDPAALRPGVWGIPASAPEAPMVHAIDVAIVPGIAFDDRGRRLGHGAGYCDRWLASHPSTLRVGVGYECQLIDEVPSEPHDEPMDRVVTERRVVAVDTSVSRGERARGSTTSRRARRR